MRYVIPVWNCRLIQIVYVLCSRIWVGHHLRILFEIQMLHRFHFFMHLRILVKLFKLQFRIAIVVAALLADAQR